MRVMSITGTAIIAMIVAAAASVGTAAEIRFQEGAAPAVGFTAPDAQIRQSSPTSTYAGPPNGNLDVGRIGGGAVRSMILFDLSAGLKAADQVESISLQLTKSREAFFGTTRTINLYRVAPFTESEVTWNNATSSTSWNTAGGDYDAASPLVSVVDTSAINGTLTFGSTPEFVGAAQDALQNHGGKLYLLLSAPAVEALTTTNIYAGFYQSDSVVRDGQPLSVRPLLTVTTVPEPVGMLLLAPAGLMLARGTWRR